MAHRTNISVNGETVPVWEFDHTAQEIDDAVDRSYAAVRPNLLVNPYFTASRPGGALPVNQRGAPQYSGGGAEKYTIDQWIATSDCRSLVPQSDGLSLTAIIAGQYPLYQPLDGDYSLYASRTYTVSALMGDGTLISGTGTFPASAPQSGNAVIAQSASVGAFDIKLFYNASTGQVRVGFYANSASANALILACKMEEGEGQTLGYQDSTGAWRLLPQPDDDYQTQLAKCKYFFNRYNYVQGTLMGLGIAASSSLLGIVTQIPVMRANPSIIPSSVSSIKADQANISNGISSTGISSSYMDEAGNITISLNFGGDLTPGAVYFVGLTGGYIDFSAEL